MAVFRVERNTGYTVMSNHHLRNKELSLKAKGLLSQMLSLPEDWDYTMSNADVPIWEKYTLTIDEAAKYFRIGENKLRKLAEENPAAGWVIMNGNRIQIKRKQFEKMIDTIDTI